MTFTRLLTALQRIFDGEPDRLDVAMGVMFELKLTGQVLASQPATGPGIPGGQTAGPIFQYAIINQ